MSWFGDNLNFEKFNLKRIADQVGHNPLQALVGADDPASTKAWNGLLGTKFSPMVDQFGGPTSSTFNAAAANGINTGPASTMHGIAHGIVGAEAGGYGLGQLGAGGGAGEFLGDGATPPSAMSGGDGFGEFLGDGATPSSAYSNNGMSGMQKAQLLSQALKGMGGGGGGGGKQMIPATYDDPTQRALLAQLLKMTQQDQS